jgi:hypothetical protein
MTTIADMNIKPVAWIDKSGHPKHLSYVQGVREKQLYGPLRPLYESPTRDVKDATRYRWLREHTATTGLSIWMRDIQFLDDAIDAAIKDCK